jgi:hypothetical protein
MNKRKKVVVLLVSILIASVIFMLGYWMAKSESNTLVRIDSAPIWAAIHASPSPQTPALQQTIRFSIRSPKTCYVLHEPVEIWTELVNLSDEAVTILKTLHFFTGGGLYHVTALVNGKLNSRQVTAFARGDMLDDYVTLLLGEGAVTRVPNFLDLVGDLDGKPRESSTGQFDLALQYKNWIPNVLDELVLTGNTFLFQVYGDRPVWTGLLESNAITVNIVDAVADCGTTTSSTEIFSPEPTVSGFR